MSDSHPHKWTTVRVVVWEMDRFSGRKVWERHEFPNREEAERFVRQHNAGNTGPTPDWYLYAEIAG